AAHADVVPTLDQHTRQTIRRVVDECGGNLSAAARRLGVSRGLLYRRLRG
ncbi:MAG: Fis family transcriptional regulator, partial [Rubrivivax sp.]|nr:Fis family transcriptional regulator [Rubrivivax sp.]